MRIGLLIYGDMEAVSGGYLYNRKLAAYLRSHGVQVEIISLPLRSYWRHLGDNFSTRCLEQITAANVDLLIQDAMVHPSVVLINRQLNIPVVTLVHLLASFDHHPGYSAWFYRAIERRYLKSVSGIIANSLTTLAQIRELLHDPSPPHCLAVPAGDNFSGADIDIDTIKQRALIPGPLKILVVGNVIRRKGLHVLIQALRLLPAENFQVTVAGRLDMEPDYVQQVQKSIRAAQLQERVILKGPVQGLSLADLYLQHHLMALPSSYESYGIVYVEAQQFGLPVIGTTEGAAKEIISHGDNGYLVPPEDPQALAELLQKLHHDRPLLLTMGRNALAAYIRHPRWDESCEIIRQYLYTRINRI
jgi:glycosyltransferase involved in cell wall biosynthesis